MAKGRKPQLSLDDLKDWLDSYSRKRSGVGGAPLRAAEKFGEGTKATMEEASEFVSPWSMEELERMESKGFDRNHAATLALYAALTAASGPLTRGIAKTARGTKRVTYDPLKQLVLAGLGRR